MPKKTYKFEEESCMTETYSGEMVFYSGKSTHETFPSDLQIGDIVAYVDGSYGEPIILATVKSFEPLTLTDTSRNDFEPNFRGQRRILRFAEIDYVRRLGNRKIIYNPFGLTNQIW